MLEKPSELEKALRIFKRGNSGLDLQRARIYLPVNINQTHWALVEINFATRTINYVDSMRSLNKGREILRNVKNFLEKFDGSLSFQEVIDDRVPQQSNMCDCGVFLLAAIINRIADVDSWTYSQQDMNCLLYTSPSPRDS
eukprot:TRINITY_DN8690_c0_g1_i3.p1 TRINITY_DN8690_c0_g1~~TRINITY_DN8690_c0_g1_i3.p1  ORF type:complete len:140 (-),score=25.16 TRINITY_DN8690_c0_g1_i3:38-457(-)